MIRDDMDAKDGCLSMFLGLLLGIGLIALAFVLWWFGLWPW